ncbi:hypothetical protein KM92DES2_11974 [uncultured Desulfovibrio sp.]|uniref:Uncharacterized protein n=1 Tax=uncultured Desulfovibrio sp. TaxID=167968 RepID=A0A212JZI4_9BACT|nr:hypothetical protein KM92DES2_11974 [uncultured Desulfovibrio sp.]
MQNPLLQPPASCFAVAFRANPVLRGLPPLVTGLRVEVQKNLLAICPREQGSSLLHLLVCVDKINTPSAGSVGAFCYAGPPSSDDAISCDTKMHQSATAE